MSVNIFKCRIHSNHLNRICFQHRNHPTHPSVWQVQQAWCFLHGVRPCYASGHWHWNHAPLSCTECEIERIGKQGLMEGNNFFTGSYVTSQIYIAGKKKSTRHWKSTSKSRKQRKKTCHSQGETSFLETRSPTVIVKVCLLCEQMTVTILEQ